MQPSGVDSYPCPGCHKALANSVTSPEPYFTHRQPVEAELREELQAAQMQIVQMQEEAEAEQTMMSEVLL